VIRRATIALTVALLASLPTVVAAGADATTSGAPQGNVTPTTQPKQGVAVVAVSAPVDGRVALLLHNGTVRPVRIDLVTAIATSSGGGLATRSRTTASYPQYLAPDGLSLAAVTFRTRALRPGAVVTAKVRSTPVSAARAARTLAVSNLALSPPQTGAVAQTMGAILTNGTTTWTARSPQTAVMCFGEAGDPTTFSSTRATTRRIAPGGTASVSVPLTSLCPAYLVAARAT
jgi:hypothetical protein